MFPNGPFYHSQRIGFAGGSKSLDGARTTSIGAIINSNSKVLTGVVHSVDMISVYESNVRTPTGYVNPRISIDFDSIKTINPASNVQFKHP